MRTIDPVRHEERRQQILAVAERCFVRDGFRGASISDICKDAKISPGHLYHYFSSKEDIVRAITENSLEYATEWLARIVRQPDPVEAFVAALESARIEQFHNRQLLALDMLAEAGRNPISPTSFVSAARHCARCWRLFCERRKRAVKSTRALTRIWPRRCCKESSIAW